MHIDNSEYKNYVVYSKSELNMSGVILDVEYTGLMSELCHITVKWSNGIISNHLEEELEVVMKETRIFNGTSHPINFYKMKDCISIQDGRKLIKKEGALPFSFFPPGQNLNAEKRNKPAPKGLVTTIPVKGALEFISVDPLPNDYDLYIVSQLYRAAAKEVHGYTANLATIEGAVYENENSIRPCGCLSLSVG